jgi:DNA (cytosine-5)-methyltransferase 1
LKPLITPTRAKARLNAGMFDELIVDNFAGGGGASMGIEAAMGRSVDIAINHDPHSIHMHQFNHPFTKHLCEDVWDVDPLQAVAGRSVGLAWFSPDCKHFSRAKGGKPVNKKIRGLAWIAIRWAKLVKPRVIILENVREFQDWGPLTSENMPCSARKGQTFRRWRSTLENLGYVVEHRVLNAADFGAPTHRRRFFLVARCDGRPIA